MDTAKRTRKTVSRHKRPILNRIRELWGANGRERYEHAEREIVDTIRNLPPIVSLPGNIRLHSSDSGLSRNKVCTYYLVRLALRMLADHHVDCAKDDETQESVSAEYFGMLLGALYQTVNYNAARLQAVLSANGACTCDEHRRAIVSLRKLLDPSDLGYIRAHGYVRDVCVFHIMAAIDGVCGPGTVIKEAEELVNSLDLKSGADVGALIDKKQFQKRLADKHEGFLDLQINNMSWCVQIVDARKKKKTSPYASPSNAARRREDVEKEEEEESAVAGSSEEDVRELMRLAFEAHAEAFGDAICPSSAGKDAAAAFERLRFDVDALCSQRTVCVYDVFQLFNRVVDSYTGQAGVMD